MFFTRKYFNRISMRLVPLFVAVIIACMPHIACAAEWAIVDKLNLDKKTAAKFSKLRSKYADLFKAPGKPGEKGERPSKEDMDKRMAQHKKYLNELKSILNDSQYSAYEKLEPQRGPGNKKK